MFMKLSLQVWFRVQSPFSLRIVENIIKKEKKEAEANKLLIGYLELEDERSLQQLPSLS